MIEEMKKKKKGLYFLKKKKFKWNKLFMKPFLFCGVALMWPSATPAVRGLVPGKVVLPKAHCFVPFAHCTRSSP